MCLSPEQDEQADEWLTLCSQSYILPNTSDFDDLVAAMKAAEVPEVVRDAVVNTLIDQAEAHL
jgi:hypothetical protein